MENPDEQTSQKTILIWEGFINGLSRIHESKIALQHYVADYIESIELPEKEVAMTKKRVAGDHPMIDKFNDYSNGYNACLKDCQAKLDEAVKELRNGQ